MDSRTVFVLLWTLLSSTSTGIQLDGNGYVDITIAISSKVPQDNRLIDKIKVNVLIFVYLTNFVCIHCFSGFCERFHKRFCVPIFVNLT